VYQDQWLGVAAGLTTQGRLVLHAMAGAYSVPAEALMSMSAHFSSRQQVSHCMIR
jgi:hypothetical protein